MRRARGARRFCEDDDARAIDLTDFSSNSDIHGGGTPGAPVNAMARDHRKLTAFSLADDLAVQVYALTTRFDLTEHYGLRAQIRRAAVSVPTNIVEGAARDSHAEYLRFLEIALGSSRELQYLLDLAQRLDFLQAASAKPVGTQADRVAAKLGALRRALRTG
jgi:four helix bundle protein